MYSMSHPPSYVYCLLIYCTPFITLLYYFSLIYTYFKPLHLFILLYCYVYRPALYCVLLCCDGCAVLRCAVLCLSYIYLDWSSCNLSASRALYNPVRHKKFTVGCMHHLWFAQAARDFSPNERRFFSTAIISPSHASTNIRMLYAS